MKVLWKSQQNYEWMKPLLEVCNEVGVNTLDAYYLLRVHKQPRESACLRHESALLPVWNRGTNHN
jgi:hypothetical protein